MPYVQIPKDLTKVRTKVALNLTVRQLVCFGLGALVGIPSYLFTRPAIGNELATLLMIGLMMPFFLFGMYERDGQPLEKVLKNWISVKFLVPAHRPYRTQNLYANFEQESKSVQTVKTIQKTKKGPHKKANKPKKAAPITLAETIQSILSRQAQAGKSSVSQSIYNLKDASKMLNFLTDNNIMDMAGLDAHFSGMIGRQMDIGDKLKPIQRRLPVLKKHLEQYDIYLNFKNKKPLSESEKLLLTAAHSYLKGVMNGHASLPVTSWKSEYAKLTAEQKTLNQRYLALKNEVKEAEQIRGGVYNILRQEQREQQPRRAQDMDR